MGVDGTPQSAGGLPLVDALVGWLSIHDALGLSGKTTKKSRLDVAKLEVFFLPSCDGE